MRLWSLHPRLLDRAALVAGWREGLLAQKVLAGGTKGYRNHPQLDRFRAATDPTAAIAAWLHGLADEADARGYRFDRNRVTLPASAGADPGTIPVTIGQLRLELEHLRAKVTQHQRDWLPMLPAPGALPDPHPLLVTVDGPVEAWERATG